MKTSTPNALRKFDPLISEELGTYVYALRDPRDRKIFYVGMGQGSRVFDHLNDAEAAAKKNRGWTTKLRRIVEIWEADEDVEWFIIRRQISTRDAALELESTLIDTLSVSQNGPALNDIAGHGSGSRGLLSQGEVAALGAPPIFPIAGYPVVFVFPISSALANGKGIYDATRSYWSVSQSLRGITGAIAVGIAGGISRGAFKINNWSKASVPGITRWEFDSTDDVNGGSHPELTNKNWLAVVGPALGYWQRGNYLVVELITGGRFRFIRGHLDKSSVFSL